MRTHKELEAWMVANAANEGDGTAKDKAWWFVAVQLATEQGRLTLRETAQTFLHGIAPMSDNDVDEWLKNRTSDAHEMGEDLDLWDIDVVWMLNEHFGLEQSS